MNVLIHPSVKKKLFEKGCTEFNEERFFEAHEVWEELWKMEVDPAKVFLQGLIQAAGHYVHCQKGNHSGALSLADLALEKLNSIPVTPPLFNGYDLIPLYSALEYNRVRIRNAEPDLRYESFIIPKILNS